MMPKVTYVVNTYNREDKLYQALDSIVSQNYSKISIIVVDDCSACNLEEQVLTKYSSIDLKYIRNDRNLGLAKSRQIGLNAVDSEFVAFLDDDDVLVDANKTQRHVSILQEKINVSVVCSDIIEKHKDHEVEKNIQWPSNLTNHMLFRNGIIYPSTTTARKSMLINVGGFDCKFKRGIDSDLYRRLIFSGYEIYHEASKVVLYLVDADDKITDHITVKGVAKNVSSNFRTLIKYPKEFINSPRALIYRLRVVVFGIAKFALYSVRLK
ncbi:glycosyltransferase family 2 protein [Photobacterium profundum]|uniref:glycosyltransferase family 2 protein n=1 Tax=Photobacterium profundum TaxID=74109 RepID=UPI003D10698D